MTIKMTKTEVTYFFVALLLPLCDKVGIGVAVLQQPLI